MGDGGERAGRDERGKEERGNKSSAEKTGCVRTSMFPSTLTPSKTRTLPSARAVDSTIQHRAFAAPELAPAMKYCSVYSNAAVDFHARISLLSDPRPTPSRPSPSLVLCVVDLAGFHPEADKFMALRRLGSTVCSRALVFIFEASETLLQAPCPTLDVTYGYCCPCAPEIQTPTHLLILSSQGPSWLPQAPP